MDRPTRNHKKTDVNSQVSGSLGGLKDIYSKLGRNFDTFSDSTEEHQVQEEKETLEDLLNSMNIDKNEVDMV